MSPLTTPGLQVRSRRDVSRSTRRRHTPSGPGVRWRLSPSVAVRFSSDMTRVHLDDKSHRNLVHLHYRTSRRDRPSDRVFAILLMPFVTAPFVDSVGKRSWILRQTNDGWELALDVRNGRGGSFVMPGVDREGPLGEKLDLDDPRAIVETVHTLWQDADMRIAHPDQIPEVMLSKLRR